MTLNSEAHVVEAGYTDGVRAMATKVRAHFLATHMVSRKPIIDAINAIETEFVAALEAASATRRAPLAALPTGDLVERKVELITNALLHLPIRGAELQFAARQVELALRSEPSEAAARIQALEAERDALAVVINPGGNQPALMARIIMTSTERLCRTYELESRIKALMVLIEDNGSAWLIEHARAALNPEVGE